MSIDVSMGSTDAINVRVGKSHYTNVSTGNTNTINVRLGQSQAVKVVSTGVDINVPEVKFTGGIVAGITTFENNVKVASLNVTGITRIPNVSGVTTFSDIVNVGTGIKIYPATGIISATQFYGSGALLTNIPNSALDDSTVSYGGVELSLGGSDATPAFDLSDAINYSYSSLTGITTEIIGDLTPQLGGDLDVNDNDITGTGNVNLTGIISATTFNGDLTGTINTADQPNITSLGTLSNLNVSGISTFGNSNYFSDNDRIYFDETELVLYSEADLPTIEFDGGSSNGGYIILNGGKLQIRKDAHDGDQLATFNVDGGIDLYHNNSKKFETIGSGVTIFGNTETQELNVTGISTFADASTFQNDVSINGQLTVDDTLFYSELSGTNIDATGTASITTLDISGISTFSNTLTVGTETTGIVAKTDGSLTVSGISTFSNDVIFDSVGKIQLPVGTSAERLSGVAQTLGQLRYNTELSVFEGYGEGNVWRSFGNTIDADGDTFLRVESTAGSDEDTLEFITDDEVRAVITSVGNFGIGATNPSSLFEVQGNSRFTGITTFSNRIHILDNDVILIGGSSAGSTGEFKIYHDDEDDGNYIENIGIGSIIFLADNLLIRNQANTTGIASFTEDGFQVSGAITAASLDITGKLQSTGIGISVSNGSASTVTIAGPSNIIIDPGVVGDNTGTVRIKGDLFVDGTQTQINSTTIELADFIVGIATTATTDTLSDGAGIQIGPNNTFKYHYNSGTNPSLKSSENLNIASGKVYQINQTEVLSATSLGTGVTNSSLTSVGTLNELNISGIATLGSDVTVTGTLTAGVIDGGSY